MFSKEANDPGVIVETHVCLSICLSIGPAAGDGTRTLSYLSCTLASLHVTVAQKSAQAIKVPQTI